MEKIITDTYSYDIISYCKVKSIATRIVNNVKFKHEIAEHFILMDYDEFIRLSSNVNFKNRSTPFDGLLRFSNGETAEFYFVSEGLKVEEEPDKIMEFFQRYATTNSPERFILYHINKLSYSLGPRFFIFQIMIFEQQIK